MRKLLFACCIYSLFLFFPLTIHATAQAAERLVIEGEEWQLLASPLSANDSIYDKIKSSLPKNRGWSTGNWQGFIGCWEVVDSCLYLKEVHVDLWDEHTKKSTPLVFDADTLRTVLVDYYTEYGIRAGWFSEKDIIIGRGELIRYNHDAYDRNYEEEIVVTVENGRITRQEHWHNKKMTDGWGFADTRYVQTGMEIAKRFPYEQFPDFDTIRVIVSFKDMVLTPDGRFEDCVAELYFSSTKQREKDLGHPIVIAFKETLREMYPWETYYLHGKYTDGSTRVIIPLRKR